MTDRDHNEVTTGLIPPETSTPMGPQLQYVFDHLRGWPGKPEDDPDRFYDDDEAA